MNALWQNQAMSVSFLIVWQCHSIPCYKCQPFNVWLVTVLAFEECLEAQTRYAQTFVIFRLMSYFSRRLDHLCWGDKTFRK